MQFIYERTYTDEGRFTVAERSTGGTFCTDILQSPSATRKQSHSELATKAQPI